MAFNWDEIEIGSIDGINNSKYFSVGYSKHDKISEKFLAMNLEPEEKENNGNKGNICTKPFEFVQPQNKKDHSPRAYKYAQIYENKKQKLINQLQEEEKKVRVFHSKSVPNFKAIHENNFEKHLEKKPIVVPKTPLVLKKSKEVAERRKKIMDEYRKQNLFPKFIAKNVISLERKTLPKVIPIPSTCPKTPTVIRNSEKGQQRKKLLLEDLKRQEEPEKFTARDANVLHMNPFIPKKDKICTNVVPFELRMENRLKERKRYDQHYKETQEELKKQEEEKKKLEDIELVKQLRKNKTFKARPNPFK